MGETEEAEACMPPAPDAQEAVSLEARPQLGSEHKEGTPSEAHLGSLQQGAGGDSPCVALHSASPVDAHEDR